MAEMRAYEVISGKASVPTDGPGSPEVVYKGGDVLEHHLPLSEMFPFKFALVDRTELLNAGVKVKGKRKKVAAPAPKKDEPEEVTEEPEEEVAEEPEQDSGDDVTAEYPLAVNNDLTVRYVAKQGFTIFDSGKPLNSTPYRSSKEVTAKLEEVTGVVTKPKKRK